MFDLNMLVVVWFGFGECDENPRRFENRAEGEEPVLGMKKRQEQYVLSGGNEANMADIQQNARVCPDENNQDYGDGGGGGSEERKLVVAIVLKEEKFAWKQ